MPHRRKYNGLCPAQLFSGWGLSRDRGALEHAFLGSPGSQDRKPNGCDHEDRRGARRETGEKISAARAPKNGLA